MPFAVTVYCSASRAVPAVYPATAAELGQAIAREGWTLVYGGNCVGCMGELANAVRGAGGKVVGITPQLMVDEGIGDDACDELVVTSNMRDRKALLEQRGDAFVALPGGIGTFEELFEILVGRVLGYHDKPIVILNVGGYYDPLVAMLEHGIEHRFIGPKVRKAYFVSRTVQETIAFLKSHGPGGPRVEDPSAME
jgi:uncharacterized protein (TIGR00730 family)